MTPPLSPPLEGEGLGERSYNIINTIMQKIKIEYPFEGAVAKVILDDGKANILDAIMMTEITEFLISLKENKDIKLITFEGAGNNFSDRKSTRLNSSH